MFGVIVVGTAVAFGLYLQGVSIISPTKAASGVEPVSSIIISVFWLHTSSPDFLGFGLIMVTVLIRETGGRQGTEAA